MPNNCMMKPSVWKIAAYFLAVFGAFGVPFLVVLPWLNDLKARGVESVSSEHLVVLLIGLAVFLVLWFYLMIRGATWAASVPSLPGVAPISADDLRARLLAINDLNLPFQVRAQSDGRLVAEWRIAEAKWIGILQAGGLHMAHRVIMELDPATHKVRVQDRSQSIAWSAGAASVGGSWSFFQGITFFQYERGIEVGLFLKDGKWTTTAYNYRFQLSEMKNPLIEAIVASGWEFTPVAAFSPHWLFGSVL